MHMFEFALAFNTHVLMQTRLLHFIETSTSFYSIELMAKLNEKKNGENR